jgi:hypothetical protein
VLRHKPLLLVVGSVPLFAACSFLLDFNNLQGGQQANADAGPDGNSAGTGGTSDASSAGAGNLGEGGASGAYDNTSACDDGDPCTTDSCDATAKDGAHAFSPGLGLEPDLTPILADSQLRVTMTAGSDAFYFSNLSVTGKLAEVELSRLGLMVTR